MIFDRHKLTVNYYRLQRSWGKVMFLHVSVILFTRGVVSQHALQVVSQHTLQQVSRGWYPSMPCRWYPSMPCSRSRGYPRMPCRSPGPYPWGKLRGLAGGGVSPGPHLGVGVSRPTPRGVSPDPHLGEVSRPPPKGRKRVSSPTPGWSPGPQPGESPGPHLGGIPACTDGYLCRQYASYWNAFLF